MSSTKYFQISIHDVLESHLTQLLGIITVPDKLANDLSSADLIASAVKTRVLTTPNFDQYQKASILVNEVINSLKAFNDPEILVKFCDVLKIQDDPNLVRIANTMLKELAEKVSTNFNDNRRSEHDHNSVKNGNNQVTNTKCKTLLCGAVLVCFIIAVGIYGWKFLYEGGPGVKTVECYTEFEAEYGTFTGTTMHRTEASNELTVLLTFAEKIEHYFTTTSNCEVSLKGLYYSNDGDIDNVTLSIDGVFIACIETIQQNGAGYLWNVIRNSGPIGKKVHIDSGRHSLLLFIISTDLNGIEIDKTSLMFTCETDYNINVNRRCPQTLVEGSDAVLKSSYISLSCSVILSFGIVTLKFV